ncbi:hypothetical protein FHG87_007475 [Trinorchestia longiramus]|nr:hypothetical protein FHG87_007475 [Trinorchestia longiramus]
MFDFLWILVKHGHSSVGHSSVVKGTTSGESSAAGAAKTDGPAHIKKCGSTISSTTSSTISCNSITINCNSSSLSCNSSTYSCNSSTNSCNSSTNSYNSSTYSCNSSTYSCNSSSKHHMNAYDPYPLLAPSYLYSLHMPLTPSYAPYSLTCPLLPHMPPIPSHAPYSLTCSLLSDVHIPAYLPVSLSLGQTFEGNAIQESSMQDVYLNYCELLK